MGMMFLLFGQFYIYAYDHWRVLRGVPRFCFSHVTPDRMANRLLIVPCGLLAACLTFKAHSIFEHTDERHDDTKGLMMHTAMAFAGHAVVHWIFLEYLVPRLSQDTHVKATETYGTVAARAPWTWFSANPVHCLRSSYIYGHQ